jgi:hypothetical protein
MFAHGWQLLAEVDKRLGDGLKWAKSQANRVIHDNDAASLKELMAEYPALLCDGELLQMATASFGDSGDSERERQFTRAACAEVLIDAGAVVLPACAMRWSVPARGACWICSSARACFCAR